MTPEQFKKLEFNEMVDVVAGDALLQLIHGTLWRSIIRSAAEAICQWSAAQKRPK